MAYLPAAMHLRRSSTSLSLAAAAAVTLATLACSSSSHGTAPGGTKDAAADATVDAAGEASASEASAGGPDVRPDVVLDPHDCVSTGATSSEKGVGGYCSPGGGQCVHAGSGGTPALCSADLGGTPTHEWFCTIPCTMTTDCGPGGGACLSAPFGQICVPSSCANGLGDAASLTPGDAGADASDAATDATEKHDAAGKTDASGKHDGGGHDDARADSASHLDARHDSKTD